MKKLLTIALLTTFVACKDSKKNETVTDLKDSVTTIKGMPSAPAAAREKEISDSTKMLDKMLADSSNKMTPDSLK